MQENTPRAGLALSASFQRFLEDTEDIRKQFPNPSSLDNADRAKLYDAIRLLINRTRIRCIDGAWMYDASERLTENHYAGAFLDNLEHLECRVQNDKRIVPGKTTLIEVSTGSAGIAFVSIGYLLGFSTEIAIPPLELARRNAIEEIVTYVRTGKVLDSSTDTKPTDGFLNDTIGRLRERVLSREGLRQQKQQKLALPNHAEVPITAVSFRTVAKDALKKLEEEEGVIPDAIVMALGNGTSVEGMVMELRSNERYNHVQIFGFEGMHNPGVHQTLHGPLPDAVKEDRVTLYGADGTYNLSNFKKGFSSINTLIRQKVLHAENTTTVTRETWQQAFETLNVGTKRRDTVGRTSAAAWNYAMELQEKGFKNVLCIGYDKADRYGDILVTDQNATYMGNGVWNPKGVKLCKEHISLSNASLFEGLR